MRVQVLLGITVSVDEERGPNGVGNFVAARSAEALFSQTPELAVVEAKRQDIIGGMGQRVAEMVALELLNERQQRTVPAIYGCVTSGSEWQFLRLAATRLDLDHRTMHLLVLPAIMGILVAIMDGTTP